MNPHEAITILAECKPLATNLLEPGALYVYRLSPNERQVLQDFARAYESLSAPQLKLFAGEALLTSIELLYLLDLLALARLHGEVPPA